MHQPHVVILESRRFPDITEQWYNIAVGALTQLGGVDLQDKKQVITGLQGPTQMMVGKDGGVYITDMAGRIIRVDTSNWSQKIIAEGLAGPVGLAQAPSGKFIVAEAGKRQLTEIDPVSGSKRVIASDLPIGFEAGPGLPPPYLTTGVAVAADGTVYFSADRDNGIYKIRPN